MKIFAANYSILFFLVIFLYSGHTISSLSYNYYATTKCLVEPQRADYGGGIIVNPEFNHGLKGWTVFGQGIIEEKISKTGNRFLAAHSRTNSLDSFSQKILLQKGNIYTFSAWVQISEGSETVAVVFKTNEGKLIHGGYAIAEQGCWSLLKGGIVANFSSSVDILFETKNTSVDIWVDNVSLQPFTKEQWRSHQQQSINKVRKSKVRFQITSANKTSLLSAKILIDQTKSGFPFGCGINKYIISSTDYQNWFTSRFTVTAFTNEMKWYSTEVVQGQENYTNSDTMVKFVKQHNISIRGHNIFWDNPKQQPNWVKNLTSDELQKSAARRINSVVSRYAGELIHWDVMNENLHFSFYEDKLGKNASDEYYATAYRMDPKTIMFLNEYNTIEDSEDKSANPVNYVKKIQEISAYQGTAGMLLGIGLQGHFPAGQPNLAYMRSALDLLATTGLPIWLTEVDNDKDPNQAEYLEEVLREGYAHPAVKGIVSFSGPEPAGFKVMPLTDMNFKNTPSGDVMDTLLKEWKSGSMEIRPDRTGYAEVSLFHGDYSFTVKHPDRSSDITLSVKVTIDQPLEPVNVMI